MLFVDLPRLRFPITNSDIFSCLFHHDCAPLPVPVPVPAEQKKPDWSKGKPGDAKVKEEVEAEA